MTQGEHIGDEGDAATMAKLLDPVAFEDRLAEARARRAEALASREATADIPLADLPPDEFPDEPILENLPGLAARGAAVILAGIACLALIGSLLFARPGRAPEVVIATPVPASPAAVPFLPHPGAAGRKEAAPLLPRLGMLAFAGPQARPPIQVAAPLPRPPGHPPPERLAAAGISKARTAGSPDVAEAAPVLSRAVTTTLLPMITRSATLLPYSLTDGRAPGTRGATPKLVRETEDVVRQVTRTSRAAGRAVSRDVRRSDPGDALTRAIRRVANALHDNGRSNTRDQRIGSDRRGPATASNRGQGSAKASNSGRGAAKASHDGRRGAAKASHGGGMAAKASPGGRGPDKASHGARGAAKASRGGRGPDKASHGGRGHDKASHGGRGKSNGGGRGGGRGGGKGKGGRR